MAVMMTPRERWTDERLDDLNKKVDDGFARMDARFDRMEERFDALNRTLQWGAVAVIVALIGSNATLIGAAFY